MAQIIIPQLDYSKLNNIKSFKNYLFQLHDNLDYMFSNIDTENLDVDSLNILIEHEGNISELIHDSQGLEINFSNAKKDIESGLMQNAEEIELYVDTGKVTNSINLSTDEILVQGNRLEIDTDNIKLTADNKLIAEGTIIAKAGMIAGFEIASDASGRYLKGTSDSSIMAGCLEGVKASFKTFRCRDTIAMNGQTWNMYGVDIKSVGLKFTASFSVADMDIARFSESRDEYTAWYPLTADEKIYATRSISVGKNGDDSGRVSCLSVYSYFDGERPGDYVEDEEPSDRDLKRSVTEIDGKTAHDFLRKIRPVKYKLLRNDDVQLGFTAQNILEAGQDEYGIVSKSDEGYYSVNYMRFVPIITAALQYTDEKIKEIKERESNVGI